MNTIVADDRIISCFISYPDKVYKIVSTRNFTTIKKCKFVYFIMSFNALRILFVNGVFFI